jgi:hypothetical protein
MRTRVMNQLRVVGGERGPAPQESAVTSKRVVRNWKGCRWHLGQADAGRTCSINLFDRLTPKIHSAAEFFEDPIVLDGLADHGIRILRPGKGQVNESGRVDSISKRLLLQNRDFTNLTCKRLAMATEF